MPKPKVNEVTPGVYALVNHTKNKLYIGSAFDINVRWNAHIAALKRGDHQIKTLQDDFNNTKGLVLSLRILQKFKNPTNDKLIRCETKWIAKFWKSGLLYNTAKIAIRNHYGKKGPTVSRPLKVQNQDFKEILRFLKEGYKQQDVAKFFGVSQATISYAKNGKHSFAASNPKRKALKIAA